MQKIHHWTTKRADGHVLEFYVSAISFIVPYFKVAFR